jgi:DNA-binding NarL/FixJ family response regulator
MALVIDVIADTGWAAEGLASALQRATPPNAIAARPVSLERWLAEFPAPPSPMPELLVALLPDTASGLQVLKRLLPDTPVLWLHAAPDTAMPIDPGPHRPLAWLPADATETQLAAAIQALAHGLSVRLPASFHADHVLAAPAPLQELVEPLTARELEVLELMAKGLANREIAEALGISVHTAKFHVAQILDKTGSATRTEAVRQALRVGLIGL